MKKKPKIKIAEIYLTDFDEQILKMIRKKKVASESNNGVVTESSDNIAIAKIDTSKVTRLEIVDEQGRAFSSWNDQNKIELSLQDEGRTLKIFISKRR